MKLFTLKYLPTLPLLVSLAACTVGPDYQQPESRVPAEFKYEAGWQTIAPQSWAAQGDWWTAFKDPELSVLIIQANAANQNLAQAEARYRAAQGQWRLARGDYSPQLDASLSGSRDGGDSISVTESYSARLSASWAPDLWGRVRRSVEASRTGMQSSAADLVAAGLNIQLAVAQSYIRLRALDAQRLILEQTMETYARSTVLTQNQYKAGIVPRSDVIQAETQQQALKSDLIDLASQRALEENSIAVLLGKAPVNFTLTPEGKLPELPVLPASLPSTLISRRPDVVSAERQLASASAQIGVAQAAWLPSFTISAGYGANAGRFGDLFDAPNAIWSVGPSLVQTLFDGGARRASKAIAVAQYDEQLAAYRQTVLDGLAEVENALATLSLLKEKTEQQAILLELAEENERIVNNRYKSGLVTFLEVATAQNQTLNTRRTKVATEADRLQAALQLAAVIGGGWDLDDPVVQSVNHAQSQNKEGG
ncbi:Outer membrane protein OprM [Zhongshania aliphaticivorans]|uniref:Outer membrane protein OprM n=1 Tax=Zhongshania aliphaticivorans TaxID=1470434 RepID=A0A5S9P6Y4_9GAMM|nr:efflux transporter outer membrane subunit [Zhongshania aliphaticivorans]CAA0091839.1 Outer membrane protein OprM [Zhongshania aliphaticivorans]CAA0099175.1 Outer membrane protein OprM [Zhongshania aliphaticivorans]